MTARLHEEELGRDVRVEELGRRVRHTYNY
jgi:hypothetical protein